MSRIIKPDPSISPREIFARMQGAWFEPRQGYMWQENTGATATTSGGQTIGKLVDLSAGRVAFQATAANRPLFGARRNLLTYTEDFSNAAWEKLTSGTGAISYTNNYTTNDRGVPATRLIFDLGATPATAVSRVYAQTNPLRSSNEIRTKSLRIKTNNGSTVTLFIVGKNSIINTLITVTGSWATFTFTDTVATDPAYAQIQFGLNGALGTANYADVSVSELQLELGSTATDYQRVTTATDYDAGRFPTIRHADSTDVLTATLPAINVRRNLLTYSEQFDNAAWVKQQAFVTPNAAIAPDGTTTADLLYEQANVNIHNIYQLTSIAGTVVSTISVYAKESTRRYLVLNISTTSTDWAIAAFDLRTGAVTQQSTGETGSIVSAYSISDRNGYFRCILTATTANANRSSALMLSNASTFAPQGYGVVIYSGDGASGIHIWGAQHELGSVATEYQKITDWTSEQFSSSGSVYFSTPQGMSCLHNQSIGTTYSLPAMQTDNYCTVITPERLAPPLEQRLALYMHRLAGIADADFFWQEDYGPELVTNGDFSNGIAGWTISEQFTATDNGNGTVTFTGAANNVGFNSIAFQFVPVTVGKTYKLIYTEISDAANCGVGVYMSGNTGDNVLVANATGIYTFVATSAMACLHLFCFDQWANIGFTISQCTCRELKDGMVGQLLADDNDTILLRA